MGYKNFSDLSINATEGAGVEQMGLDGWRLEIPTGPGGKYRVAQVDDYCGLPRRAFSWQPPFRMRLEARASAVDIQGTWGFGLWNDPFGVALVGGRRGLYLPALPNAAWFFFASPPNYLSLRDDLPAVGGLAAAFRSPRCPSLLLAPGALAAPLLFLRPAVRWLRRLAGRVVHQDSAALSFDPRQWHEYEMAWTEGGVEFCVDGDLALRTALAPAGPLGLVIWVDNQYAALPPSGRLGYGVLPTHKPAWIEVRKGEFFS